MGDHARLARAGPSDDEQRAIDVRDGLTLSIVQPFENAVLSAGHDPEIIGTDRRFAPRRDVRVRSA